MLSEPAAGDFLNTMCWTRPFPRCVIINWLWTNNRGGESQMAHLINLRAEATPETHGDHKNRKMWTLYCILCLCDVIVNVNLCGKRSLPTNLIHCNIDYKEDLKLVSTCLSFAKSRTPPPPRSRWHLQSEPIFTFHSRKNIKLTNPSWQRSEDGAYVWSGGWMK